LSGVSESRSLCCDPTYVVEAVDFSADGQAIAAAGRDGLIHLWNVATGKPIGDPWQHPNAGDNGVFGLAFSSQSAMLASVPLPGTPLLWDTAQNTKRPIPLKDKSGKEIHGWYESVRFAHKQPWLVAAGFGPPDDKGKFTKGRVTTWNADGSMLFS